MDLEIEKAVDIFDKLGRFEYPVRGLTMRTEDRREYKREIYDVETGELLSSASTQGYARIVFVLDGDHGIDLHHQVHSFSKKKVVQKVEEMEAFFGRANSDSENFVSLTIPKKYTYSARFTARKAKTYGVFDSDFKERKFITCRLNGNDRMVVWNWETNGVSGEVKKVKKEYEYDFKNPIIQVIALPKESRVSSECEVAVALFGKSFVIFDVTGKRILREIEMKQILDPSLFLLPNGHLCVLGDDFSLSGLRDVTDKLKKQYRLEIERISDESEEP